jgi:hypothetical protein
MDGNGCFDGQRDATVEWAAAHPSLAPDATQNLAALRAGQTIWGGWNVASIRFFTQVGASATWDATGCVSASFARGCACALFQRRFVPVCVCGVLPASCSW